MSQVRVLLADDHAVVRAGIRNALEGVPGLEIVGEAKDGPSLLAELENLRPDFLVIDVTMPDFEPITAIQQIHQHYPKMKILVVSAYDDDVYVQGLLRAGVNGYHLKDQPLRDLRLAVQQVLSGEKWISSPLVDKLIHFQESPSGTLLLTPRQRQILGYLRQGLDNQTIALRLHLSIKTIENHLTRIYRLLGVQSRLEAASFLAQHPQTLTLDSPETIPLPAPPAPETMHGVTLLVDDNPRYLNQLRRTIKKLCPKMVIYEAENIQQAVQQAERTNIQLALVDVLLGEESGIQCARQLKAIAPQTRIILISAYPDKEFHRQGLQAGASAFLDKKDLDSATLRQIFVDIAAYDITTP
ncbi:MAG: response regulator [Anaerolineales bacterium]|nr:response regulator [Anaerolineales bacterium]